MRLLTATTALGMPVTVSLSLTLPVASLTLALAITLVAPVACALPINLGRDQAVRMAGRRAIAFCRRA